MQGETCCFELRAPTHPAPALLLAARLGWVGSSKSSNLALQDCRARFPSRYKWRCQDKETRHKDFEKQPQRGVREVSAYVVGDDQGVMTQGSASTAGAVGGTLTLGRAVAMPDDDSSGDDVLEADVVGTYDTLC